LTRELEPTRSQSRPRRQPLEGGYYWFPSPSPGSVTWKVLPCHEMGFDSDDGHVDLWPAVIARLATTWNMDARVLKRRLKNQCYGLPRGRVTRPDRRSLILHGNDAPISGWLDEVVRRFNLDSRSIKSLYDEHETMLAGDRMKLIETFGVKLPEIPRESDMDR
jgi:hypothetical protein